MHLAITSLLKDKLPPFKWVLLFYNFYNFYNFTSVIEIKFIVSLCFLHIYVCVISSSHKSESEVEVEDEETKEDDGELEDILSQEINLEKSMKKSHQKTFKIEEEEVEVAANLGGVTNWESSASTARNLGTVKVSVGRSKQI